MILFLYIQYFYKETMKFMQCFPIGFNNKLFNVTTILYDKVSGFESQLLIAASRLRVGPFW